MTRRSGGYLSSIGGVFSTRVLGAASSVLAARLLGPSDRGTLGLVVFAIALASIVTTSGVDVWVSRTVASERVAMDDVRDVACRHLGSAAALLLVVGAGIGAGSAVGLLPSSPLGPEALVVAVLMIGVTTWSMLRLALLGGLGRMKRVAIAQACAAGTYTAWVGALLIVGHPSLTAVLLGATAGTLVLAVVAGASLTPSRHPAADHRLLRSARRFGLPVMVGELFAHATTRADLVVLAAMRGTDAVGVYVVAAALSELLWIVPNGVSQFLLPQVSRDPEPEHTCGIVALTSWMGIAGGLVLTAVAAPVVGLTFGREFSGAVAAVPALCVAAVALGAWKLLVADLAARGDTMVRPQTSALSLVAMVVLDVPLIAWLDVPGAALASALAYTLAAVTVAIRWRRRTGMPARRLVALGSAIGLVREFRRMRASAREAPASDPRDGSSPAPGSDGGGDTRELGPADRSQRG